MESENTQIPGIGATTAIPYNRDFLVYYDICILKSAPAEIFRALCVRLHRPEQVAFFLSGPTLCCQL